LPVKKSIQSVIRSAHLTLASGLFPDRASIIMHELLPRQHSAFADSVALVRECGYQTHLPQTYLEKSPVGSKAATDDRRLLVTFDDNFAHWHSALPLLDDIGLKAIFFVTTGPTLTDASTYDVAAFYGRIDHREDPVPLTRSQLLDIRAAGHEIGCHTEWHRSLAGLIREEWNAEIRQSKERLEDLFGEEISDFSFPFGVRRHFNQSLTDYCTGVGFKRIYSGQPGRLFDGTADPMNIPRTRWNLDAPPEQNVSDLKVDGRLFETVTGRSPVG